MEKYIVVQNVDMNTGEKSMNKKDDAIKEITCNKCKKRVVPILKKNKLKDNFYGQIFTGQEKKYLLVCPNCKTIIGSR